MHFLLSHACYMPINLIFLDLITRILRKTSRLFNFSAVSVQMSSLLSFFCDLMVVIPLKRSVRGDEIKKNRIAFTATRKSKSPYRMNYQAKQALVLLISSLTVTTEKNFGGVHCVYKEIYVVLSHIFLHSIWTSYFISTLFRFRRYYPLHFIKF